MLVALLLLLVFTLRTTVVSIFSSISCPLVVVISMVFINNPGVMSNLSRARVVMSNLSRARVVMSNLSRARVVMSNLSRARVVMSNLSRALRGMSSIILRTHQKIGPPQEVLLHLGGKLREGDDSLVDVEAGGGALLEPPESKSTNHPLHVVVEGQLGL